MPPQLVIQTDIEDVHAETANCCARFIAHLFNCPNNIPLPGPTDSPIQLKDMIAHTLRQTQLDLSVAYGSLLLLQRLKVRFPAVQANCGYRMFLTAYMLASKVICDQTYSAKSWCAVSQGIFSVVDINTMEREMCSYLEHQVEVSHPAIQAFRSTLQEAMGASRATEAVGFCKEHVTQFERNASTAYDLFSICPSSSVCDYLTPPLSPSSSSTEAPSPPDTPTIETPIETVTLDDALNFTKSMRPTAVLWSPVCDGPPPPEDDYGFPTVGFLGLEGGPDQHVYETIPHHSFSSAPLHDDSLVHDRMTYAPLMKTVPLPHQGQDTS